MSAFSVIFLFTMSALSVILFTMSALSEIFFTISSFTEIFFYNDDHLFTFVNLKYCNISVVAHNKRSCPIKKNPWQKNLYSNFKLEEG